MRIRAAAGVAALVVSGAGVFGVVLQRAQAATVPVPCTSGTAAQAGQALASAVAQSNLTPGDDVLQLQACTYLVSATMPVTDATGSLTIAGVAGTTIDGNDSTQLFSVATSAHLVVQSTTLTRARNATGDGGAVANAGTLDLVDSSVVSNVALNGGGVTSSGTLTSTRSLFASNTSLGRGTAGPAVGPHAQVTAGTATFDRTTFARAVNSDGAGALYLSGGAADVVASTFTGIVNYALYVQGTGSVQLRSTSIGGGGKSCLGTLPADRGLNVTEDSTCGLTATTSRQGTPPRLLPLGDYGGLTRTAPPGPGSPLLDLVPSSACTATTDARGTARPQGPACDVGAVESAASVALNPLSAQYDQTDSGQTGMQTIRVTSKGGDPLRLAAAQLVPTGTPYAIQRDGCQGAVVASGDTCTIDVSFSPTDTAPHEATLRLVDNAYAGPHEVDLAGVGRQPSPTPSATAPTSPTASPTDAASPSAAPTVDPTPTTDPTPSSQPTPTAAPPTSAEPTPSPTTSPAATPAASPTPVPSSTDPPSPVASPTAVTSVRPTSTATPPGSPAPVRSPAFSPAPTRTPVASPLTSRSPSASSAPATASASSSPAVAVVASASSSPAVAVVASASPPAAAAVQRPQRSGGDGSRLTNPDLFFTAYIPPPSEVPTALGQVLQSGLLALLLLALLSLPVTVVNDTLSEHREEVAAQLMRVRGWFSVVPRLPAERIPQGVALLAAAVGGALINSFLDPSFGLNRASAVDFCGLLGSLLALSAISRLCSDTFCERRFRADAVLRVLPGFWLLAMTCVVLSRTTGFRPGLLLGTLAAVQVSRALNQQEAGEKTAFGYAVTAVVSLGAWLAYEPVTRYVDSAQGSGAGAGFGVLVLQTVLATVFLGGVGGSLFGLVPLEFMDGGTLKRWSTPVWFGLFFLALFGFVHVLLRRDSADDPLVQHVGYLEVLLAVYLLCAAAFWGYWRWHDRRAARAGAGPA